MTRLPHGIRTYQMGSCWQFWTVMTRLSHGSRTDQQGSCWLSSGQWWLDYPEQLNRPTGILLTQFWTAMTRLSNGSRTADTEEPRVNYSKWPLLLLALEAGTEIMKHAILKLKRITSTSWDCRKLWPWNSKGNYLTIFMLGKAELFIKPAIKCCIKIFHAV